MADYTAQEMRDFADAIAYDLNESGHTSVRYTYDDLIPVIESLRQAADAMEHKKKYEYAVYFVYECGIDGEEHFKTLDDAKSFIRRSVISRATISRREVGEWKEVKDGER